ncbi:hypothetical protein EDD85DRAFT_794091 [Armillaria nabsnona]|nr:hypothetical protein EDD85DRAFT_794091 [Armillaria nabsnona]
MTGTHQEKDAQSFHTRLNLSTSDNYEDYHSGHSYENSLIYYPFNRPIHGSYKTNISAFAKDTSTNESVILEFSSGSKFIVYTSDPSHLMKTPDKIFSSDHQFAIVLAGHTRQEETNRIFDMDLCLQRLLTLIICLIMIATLVFGFRQWNEIVVIPIGMMALILLGYYRVLSFFQFQTFTWNELDQMRLNNLTEKALLHYSKHISTTCKECVWCA